MAEIDFEAEGLLEGVDGEARDARRELLLDLSETGVPLDELRRAIEEDRLALLPVERVLGGEARYTPREIAEKAGVDLETLVRQQQAAGLPLPDLDDRVMSDLDLDAAKRMKSFRDAGLDPDGLLEVSRVLGMSMSQTAAATRRLIGDSFIQPGDNERDVGMRFAAAAETLRPMLAPVLDYLYTVHLRDQISQDVVGRHQLEAGELAGSAEIAVCFADLVGFTSLGERLDAAAIGALGGKLASLATGVANTPVRLVKLIGDAAMLVAPDTGAIVEAALSLVEAAEEDEELPPLHAGVATGTALARAGDWFGRAVNLADRITDVARPGSVLATQKVKKELGEEHHRWSFAGERSFKGIKGDVKLFRVRRRLTHA
ncbi:MAG: adenylate/guanylate cyclase domain-containing protein [Solirubrobacterales bacterium]|nr:adenylate/guanylate cyclase domain-containing protein [Solirubrobacterales bacterium]